ncbi:hypothetical protein L0Y40_01550 [Candidatus Wolfebacteria bacterium]|nr:hypothetical protein [Candidatus Wolfebacteria bacterium]
MTTAQRMPESAGRILYEFLRLVWAGCGLEEVRQGIASALRERGFSPDTLFSLQAGEDAKVTAEFEFGGERVVIETRPDEFLP